MKILFSTDKYSYLKERIHSIFNFGDGQVERKKFPDGERYLRIISDVEDKDVALIGGTISDEDTLELYDLAIALVKYGALSLTIVIPYFGYSTMERAVIYGEGVTAKNRAMLISSIPRTNLGNQVVLIDLHSEGIPFYFEEGIRTVHLYCKSIIMQVALEMGGNNFVLASTDAGRAKWVESLANEMKVNAAFVFKRRISLEKTEVTSITADVKNKNVIIYDDILRTGGSLINAAKAYKAAGAKEISVIVTHGLFVKDAFKKIRTCGLFKKIVCTDTHPNALKFESNFLTVKSIAKLVVEKIK